jgi:hypothetical protein
MVPVGHATLRAPAKRACESMRGSTQQNCDRSSVNRAPDGTEHARDTLPLVKQHGRREASERGIGVGLERHRTLLLVEPGHRVRSSRKRCHLAGRAEPNHKHRGQLLQQRVDGARTVGDRLRCSPLTGQISATTRSKS